MLQELYQEVIIDHGKSPRNSGVLEKATHEAEGYNPYCGDEVHLTVVVKDGVIVDLKFEGQGCAISQASASMMTEAVKGKNVEEAKAIFKRFHDALMSREDPDYDALDELASLTGVKDYPSRIKCATLAWHCLEDALEGQDA
jgi:nitrogen fixation NifU-like protein